jgi:hypothetical protein
MNKEKIEEVIKDICDICYDEVPIEELAWDSNNKCRACSVCQTDSEAVNYCTTFIG